MTFALGQTRRAAQIRRDLGTPWKLAGQLELLRDPLLRGDSATGAQQIPRFRMAFDPVHDLHWTRATYDLARAVELGSDDFATILYLATVLELQGMTEAALPWLEELMNRSWTNTAQKSAQEKLNVELPAMRRSLGPLPKKTWDNQNELGQMIAELLQRGRAKSAAELIERAHPRPEARSWETADQLATLYLHLGLPAKARAVWSAVASAPRPAVRDARVAATYLVEQDFEPAREHYRRALQAEPKLFEALYGLAVLEQDDSRAAAALVAAERAAEIAPGPLARERAAAIADAARPVRAIPTLKF